MAVAAATTAGAAVSRAEEAAATAVARMAGSAAAERGSKSSVLGGGGEDRWATANDGEDGGGYERCPLRRRTARAERAIKFATDSATEPVPAHRRIPGRLPPSDVLTN